VPTSEFQGAQAVNETMYEYEDGLLVRSVTTAEARWTDTDRGLLLALLAERKDVCPSCGHPMSVCRDPSTAGSWTVVQEVCQPTRVAQAEAEKVAEAKPKKRGVVFKTKRT
jgi:hypothetical protein